MDQLPEQFRVTSHTDHVGPGSTFVAVKGFKEDGAQYIPVAIEKGATCVVIEQDVVLGKVVKEKLDTRGVEVFRVPSARKAFAELSAEAYGYPARKLTLIGITGTKGKTTTAYILEHLLRTAGHKTALLGTISNRILDKEYEGALTTPQPDYLHAFFAQCLKQGVEYVIMEAAAQALSVNRLDTLAFDSVVFTNFSLEHSEFYKSLDEYFRAKCTLFRLLAPNGLVVLNADEPRVASCVPEWPLRETISLEGAGTYTAEIKESSLRGLELEIETPTCSFSLSCTALLGRFSAYNVLSAVAVAQRYGVSPESIKKALASFTGVPGRICSYLLPNKAVALIDNAHTPSSYEALFKAVRPLSPHIIALFGAGGDRDAIKRPLMGALAAQYADQVILTTDNPRSEEVDAIIADILKGIQEDQRQKVHIDHDRERAIRTGYSLTKEGSLLILLGKGPVEYQHIKDKKIPFSEVAILGSLRS